MIKKIILKDELLTIKKIYSKPALLIWWFPLSLELVFPSLLKERSFYTRIMIRCVNMTSPATWHYIIIHKTSFIYNNKWKTKGKFAHDNNVNNLFVLFQHNSIKAVARIICFCNSMCPYDSLMWIEYELTNSH